MQGNVKITTGPAKLNNYASPFFITGGLTVLYMTFWLFCAFYATEGVICPQYQIKGSDDKNKEHIRDFSKVWGERETS